MPRAFLVKKSASTTITSPTNLSVSHNKTVNSDKKTLCSDVQKPGDVAWEPLDMSEYENDLQTAHTVQIELDYQKYSNRRTPSPVGEVSRQNKRAPSPVGEVARQSPMQKRGKYLLSSNSEENGRRMPLFYAPHSKPSDEFTYNDEDVEKPFECRHCIISFSRLNELQNHMELHSIKKPFKFSDMRHTFDDSLIENQLKSNHSIKSLIRPSTSDVQFHSPEKPFKCENEIDKVIIDNADRFNEKSFDFNRRFYFPRANGDMRHYSFSRSEANFFEHKDLETRTKADKDKEVVDEKPFKCRECEVSFSKLSDLQRHYEHHSTRRSSTNEDIDLTSDRESVTSEDSQTEKPFKCNHCVMSFTRPSDLQRHLLIHSSNKPYRCDKCDREFTWFGNFQKHILSHMSESSQSAGSHSAMFTLLAREQVKDLFIKEGDKYRCRLCSKDFTRLSGLKTHIRMHTGERPYVCEVCSFAFTTSRALKMHTRLHTGEKPYKCEECDRAFTRRDEMHTHMYIHKGEKPFKCTECSASFIRYGHLQRHLLIHSDDKPYKCKLCPKSFTQYRNLQTHTYKHTGERPYKCKYCPKGFTQYGTLQAHERTHTGVKPFKCQTCEKAFITSSHLRWHIKTQHGKNQSE